MLGVGKADLFWDVMSIGAFTEKNHQPTQTEVVEMLGAMLQAWQALVQHIRPTYHGQEDFKFCYGKQYGWALRFRIKGSLLTALYPARIGARGAGVDRHRRSRVVLRARGNGADLIAAARLCPTP